MTLYILHAVILNLSHLSFSKLWIIIGRCFLTLRLNWLSRARNPIKTIEESIINPHNLRQLHSIKGMCFSILRTMHNVHELERNITTLRRSWVGAYHFHLIEMDSKPEVGQLIYWFNVNFLCLKIISNGIWIKIWYITTIVYL